jgi:hypothetical protein
MPIAGSQFPLKLVLAVARNSALVGIGSIPPLSILVAGAHCRKHG